jgi:hypothetical protein
MRRLDCFCRMTCIRSLRGFVAGFGVVLGGELEDPRRGNDLQFGWLQQRILAGRLRRGDLAVVLAAHHQARAFVQLRAERLTLSGQVADPGHCLDKVDIRGWKQVVAGGGWFGRTQRLDLLARLAAAQFGIGGDGQLSGPGSGMFPFLSVVHSLGEGLFSLLVEVAQTAVAGG